jgi:hypothetical protein
MFVNTSKYIAIDIFQDNVIYTNDGSNFTTLPNLPYKSHAHCLVIVDNDTLFLAGFYGAENRHETFKYTKSRRVVYQN